MLLKATNSRIFFAEKLQKLASWLEARSQITNVIYYQLTADN